MRSRSKYSVVFGLSQLYLNWLHDSYMTAWCRTLTLQEDDPKGWYGRHLHGFVVTSADMCILIDAFNPANICMTALSYICCPRRRL